MVWTLNVPPKAHMFGGQPVVYEDVEPSGRKLGHWGILLKGILEPCLGLFASNHEVSILLYHLPP
jgi:hypothetical protein